jgi:putative redox protein
MARALSCEFFSSQDNRHVTSRTVAPITTSIRAEWRGALRFEVHGSAGAPIMLDGDKVAGAGPVDTLLGALAACSAIDVVGYLEKRRTPVAKLDIVVTAERRAKVPRRIMRAQLEFRIDGAAIDAKHAERAIELGVERYCSVASSLARDLRISTVLVLNGTAHPAIRRRLVKD